MAPIQDVWFSPQRAKKGNQVRQLRDMGFDPVRDVRQPQDMGWWATLGPRLRSLALIAVLAPAALLPLGCLSVTLYQPQKGVHRPVVIPPAKSNFAGLRVLLRCVAHREFLPPDDASVMCSNLANDLTEQGAETEWVVPNGPAYVEPQTFDGKAPDLTLEISSKIDHEYSNKLTLAASVITLTIVPSYSEATYSQRVVVFGRDRSVLTEDVFRERFVEYNGIGVWAINWIMDWFIREDVDALSGDAPKKAFTKDFHGQLRQMLHNARIRSEVLGITRGPQRRVGPPPAAPNAPAQPAANPGDVPDLTNDPAAATAVPEGVLDVEGGVQGGVQGGPPPADDGREPAPAPVDPAGPPADPADPSDLPGLGDLSPPVGDPAED